MKNALHTQNEIESDWNEMKSSNGGAANSRCSDSAGSVEAVDLTTQKNIDMLKELNETLRLIDKGKQFAVIPNKMTDQESATRIKVLRSIERFCSPLVILPPNAED